MDIEPGTWWRGKLGVGHSTVDVVVCVGKSICKHLGSQVEKFP